MNAAPDSLQSSPARSRHRKRSVSTGPLPVCDFPAYGAECDCCADCRLPYTVWYADNDLWNDVMRPDGESVVVEGVEPFLCARCFLVRAEDVTEHARVTWPEVMSGRDHQRQRARANEDKPWEHWHGSIYCDARDCPDSCSRVNCRDYVHDVECAASGDDL